MRSPADNAQLALLLEVAGTPKPGNVDRRREYDDLRFEHFLAGGVGAGTGLRAAEAGAPVGWAFEESVAGMSHQGGGNTQFGCLLDLVPLVRAAAEGRLSVTGVKRVCRETTVDDACGFYRAFDHVDVTVGDPPPDLDVPDVRRGSDAVGDLRERGLTLWDVMERSASGDGNAREWVEGFPRTFAAAAGIYDDEGPATERVARAFLTLLAQEPDTLVTVQHGSAVAREVQERAETAKRDLDAASDLADEFVEREINPGTTADLTAAAAFVALERGWEP
ncbi:triphosphoribosyl-dephospho-CoA synthase [Salinigranum sp. GCM10025319]|uniref:triphosphoribosyl-dephospho-CoA synthase n=1 Tax=Salinigranum sp. GCM10025319 TaxID=3252687 RepID=UPI00362154C0